MLNAFGVHGRDHRLDERAHPRQQPQQEHDRRLPDLDLQIRRTSAGFGR